MDELEKLFAEASASVKRVTNEPRQQEPAPRPASPPPEDPPAAAAAPSAEAPAEEAPPAPRLIAPQAPAPARPGGGPVRVTGGSRTENGLILTGPQGSHPVDWSAVSAVALGRTDRGQALAFTAGGTRYYFEDCEITYKGLVAPMEPTAPANWRSLVAELAERSGSQDDPGVQAVTGGGGVIPRHASVEAFLGLA